MAASTTALMLQKLQDRQQQQQQQQQQQLVKICRVCGDRAHAFNFSGLPSCHSCRVFFYRNAPKREKLKCLKEGACSLDFVTRKCCAYCRLARCFEIGMKVKVEGGTRGKRKSKGSPPEKELEEEEEEIKTEVATSSLSPASQLSSSSSSSESSSNDKSPFSSSQGDEGGALGSPSETSSTTSSLDTALREVLLNLNEAPFIDLNVIDPKLRSLSPPPPLANSRETTLELNPFERAQLAELRSYSSHFPEETDLEIVPVTMTCAEGFNLSSNYARRGVKYCKMVPFFRTLSREDQLRLLKPTMFDSMTIRAAFFYNKERDTYTMLENEEGTRAVEVKCWCTELAQNFQLAEENKRLTALLSEQMEKDTTIRCLLTMISLVKPPPPTSKVVKDNNNDENSSESSSRQLSVSCTETIRYYYHFYCHLFRRYLESKYGCTRKADRKYSQLMSILLTDLVVMKENLTLILLEVGVDNLAEIIVETMNLKEMLSET